MTALTQHWLATLSCLCFIYLTIGIAALDYLACKFYEIETSTSKLKNLEKLLMTNWKDFAYVHQKFFLGGPDKILTPPSGRSLFHWIGLLMAAMPIGCFLLLLYFSTLGEFRIIPDRFSLTSLTLWPKVFSESIRQIEKSHSWYAENRTRVINLLNETDQPA